MKITSVTIVFSLISMLAILYNIHRFRREEIGFRSTLVWFLMWFCIGFFSLFPNLLNPLMSLAQMQNRMFFILIMSVFVLFAFIFNIISRIDKIERDIGKLVQEISILNFKLDTFNDDKKR